MNEGKARERGREGRKRGWCHYGRRGNVRGVERRGEVINRKIDEGKIMFGQRMGCELRIYKG